MCKEDVRIGRKKAMQAGGQSVIAGSISVPLLNQNPNRATAVVTLSNYDSLEAGTLVTITSGSPNGPVIGAVSATAPVWRGTVEELGDGVTQSIWTAQQVGTDPSVSGAEAVWLLPLDDL